MPRQIKKIDIGQDMQNKACCRLLGNVMHHVKYILHSVRYTVLHEALFPNVVCHNIYPFGSKYIECHVENYDGEPQS